MSRGALPAVPEGGGQGRVVLEVRFCVWAVDALNLVIHLIQAPESLAYVLEAAGSVALERCGAILDERAASLG